MRLKTGSLIAAGAIAASLTLGSVPVRANQPEAVSVNTLTGAYLAARIAESDNDLDAAIAYYQRAHAFDPDDQTIQQSLLLGLISQGKFDEALPFARSLKETPEVERFSRLALAVDALRKEKYGEVQNWLKLALASDLDRLITGLMTGWAKLGAGDGSDALAHIKAMSGPDWYDLFVGYHRALIAEQAGDIELARKIFSEVGNDAAAGSAAPEAYLRAIEAQAGFLARQGDKEGALAALGVADSFAPGRVTIDALRETIEAGEMPTMMVPDAKAGSAEVLLNLATALNRSGGESFVRLYLQYAAALRPDSDAIQIQLAGIAEQQNDALTAISHYEKIPDDSPMKAIAELQLGLNLADLERFKEAEDHLKLSLEKNQDDMRAYLALGGVYARQENYRDAADLYEKAVARIDEPQRADFSIYYQRGIAYERLKEWDKAEPNFKKALELFPDQPQVLNYLGYSWVDMNINLEEGLKLIQRAADLRPSDGYIVDSLGWAYYRLGRYEDAVRELERAVGLMPNDPVLNDHLGDAYWQVGRKREATFQWRHALTMEPDDKVKADAERKLREGLEVSKETSDQSVMVAEGPGGTNEVLSDAAAPREEEVAAAPASEPQEAEANFHIVQPGQSLWDIAVERLGNGERFREIIQLNPSLNGKPDVIVPGQRLTLPDATR